MNPLVSVVVPTYNHAEFLGAALQSVAAQTYGPLELIVVDNFSTDDTEGVVAACGLRDLTYVKFANHGIIAASRNVGLRAARGEYVAFLDADDLWVPEKLAVQVPHLSDGSIGVVASDLRYTGARRYAPSARGRGPGGFRDYAYEEIVRGNPIATSSVVARRADLERVGGFDESPALRVIEDWDLWLRLAVGTRLRVLAQPLVTYRIAPRERPRLPLLANRLTLLEKHSRAGHLSPDHEAAARGAVHFAMGLAAFTTDAHLARENFRLASGLASSRSAFAARVAGLATRLPRFIRRPGFRMLSWANRWARFA